MRIHLITLLSVACFISVVGANDIIPAPPQANPILLKGGDIYPVVGENVPGGQLLIKEGKIAVIAPGDEALTLPEGTEVIDCQGLQIYPGLIAANTVLGLTEINAARPTRDFAEPGFVNPSARAEVAVNPDSELIPVTRANGILHALSVPQVAGNGFVSGRSALIQLDGWTWEAMTVKAPVGMHLFWPSMREGASIEGDALKAQREERDRQMRELSDLLKDVRAYKKGKENTPSGFETDVRLEAMLPVMDGTLPVFVHANDLLQIQSALQFTAREKLQMVLVGGLDAWRAAPSLKERDIPVILGPIHSLPLRRWEAYDTPFAMAARLHEAGVRFCIANEGTPFEAAHERNLPYQAAAAVPFGLPVEEALNAVTLYPAQILGVGERLGSLEIGKDATLIMTDGHPLETVTNVKRAMIQGREIDLNNRHQQLYDKYLEKYRQLEGE